MTGSVVITMAGFGTRFARAGYTVPKYRVEVAGNTLFGWSMLSLRQFARARWRFCFIVRRDDDADGFIRGECDALGLGGGRVLELDAPTDGQATTCLLAERMVEDGAAPLIVYNIDTFVEPEALAPADIRGAGWIPCCDLPGDAWSFVSADPDGRAVEVREKKRISANATIGLYYFGSFDLYRRTYDEFYSDPANIEAGERYIAPMYNHMIRKNEPVYISVVPNACFHALGTPDDVDRFRETGTALAGRYPRRAS